MQGHYKELVNSNQDFVEMIDTLAMKHAEAQKKEESARVSEISSAKKSSMMLRRVSKLSIVSSIAVRKSFSVLIYNLGHTAVNIMYNIY